MIMIYNSSRFTRLSHLFREETLGRVYHDVTTVRVNLSALLLFESLSDWRLNSPLQMKREVLEKLSLI